MHVYPSTPEVGLLRQYAQWAKLTSEPHSYDISSTEVWRRGEGKGRGSFPSLPNLLVSPFPLTLYNTSKFLETRYSVRETFTPTIILRSLLLLHSLSVCHCLMIIVSYMKPFLKEHNFVSYGLYDIPSIYHGLFSPVVTNLHISLQHHDHVCSTSPGKLLRDHILQDLSLFLCTWYQQAKLDHFLDRIMCWLLMSLL